MPQGRTTPRDVEKDTRRQATARQRTSNLYDKMGKKARGKFAGTTTEDIAKSVAPATSDDQINLNNQQELRKILGVN